MLQSRALMATLGLTLLISINQCNAFTVDINPQKAAIATVLIAPMLYFSCKDDPSPDHEPIQDALRKFRKFKFGSPEFRQHCKVFFCENILGYWGKKRGLKPYGEKLIVEGEQNLVGKATKNGEQILLYKYDSLPPYGVLGITYATMMGWASGMKKIKEAWEVAEFWGIISKEAKS